MAKRKKKADPDNPYEWQVQRRVIDALEKGLSGCIVAAVPNETRGGDYRALHEQQVKASQGAKRGFPDLIVLWQGQCVFVEVKRLKGGVVRPEQKAMHALIEGQGFDVHVVKRQGAGRGPGRVDGRRGFRCGRCLNPLT